jgi:hypothetical protein
MTAWVLMISTFGGIATVPGIASQVECERLAQALRVGDYKCFAYEAAE